MDHICINVEEEYAGERLDVFLSKQFNQMSRSHVQKIIDEKNVKVNGKICKNNYKLKYGDIVDMDVPEPKEMNIEPQDIKLDILYEDSDVIVVNKPQGMVVHPAAGIYSGTLVNALLYHCKDLSGINGVTRPGIVHRIDKDTSGVLVVAKNDLSHIKLSEQLKNHSMNRIYLALVEGIIKDDTGTIDKPLGRNPVERIKIGIVKNGKRAVTHFKVIERFQGYTLIQCKLETGRTHQIRVHMASIGHPLVGDPVYGYKKQKFNIQGQMLHAKKLGFVHPTTEEYMEFEAPLPRDFHDVLSKLVKLE